jgi:phage baseplate assembly protein gpV
MEALHTLMAPQTQQSRKQLVQGLVTAKVSGRGNDGLYLLDYLTMGSNGVPSAPARVMMPMAGGNRGTYFFPEPGDEVVVAFESGDTNLPVILGAVWNKNDPPPPPVQAQPASQNDIRTIVSKSGHELTFDDTSGTQKVTVKTQGGHSLVLDDTPPGSVTLKSSTGMTLVMDATSVSMSSPSGSSVTLDPAGITLSTPFAITMTADLGITLTATGGPIALTAPAGIALVTNGTPWPADLVAIT